jgi:hypothetical protein
MKNHGYLLKLFLTVLAVSAILGGAASAHADNNATSSQTTTFEQRVAQTKSALKLQLTAAQSQKISQKCSAAQSLVKSIAAKDMTAADKRQQVYADLSTQLTTDIRIMQGQGADITALKAAQVQFDGAINHYLTDATAYKTAMDDLSAIKCASDPAGFESLLTNARQLRTSLATDVTQVKISRDGLVQSLTTAAKSLDIDKSGASQ